MQASCWPNSRRFAIVRDYDTSLPEFEADREQLIQAVLNIVHNAAQALSRNAGGCARDPPRTRVARGVTLEAALSAGTRLHVEDNGPGVPDQLRDRIFFPLVSGREGGTGLGLTLAQTFVSSTTARSNARALPAARFHDRA